MANRAILVGINAYPNCPLQGCVNDVHDIALLLVHQFHWKHEEIRLLTDSRATTKTIKHRLEWLCQAQPGDHVIFWYSGHGAQVATRNPQDEIDGMDEVACSVEFDWSDQHMIRDKDFAAILSKMPPGVIFDWGSDSCHSGDLDRVMPLPGSPRQTPRAYPVPLDIAWTNHAARLKKVQTRALTPTGYVAASGFISGCRSDQTSADTYRHNKPCGAMTSYFIQTLMADPKQPRKQLVAGMCAALKADGYDQVPQFDGIGGDKPFQG